MTPWKFFQLILLPLAAGIAVKLGGLYTFVLPALVLIVRPVYSLTLGRGMEQGVDSHSPRDADPAYRIVALTFVPVLLAMTAFATVFASQETDPLSFMGMFLSTGIVNGVLGFTLAHELIHRTGATDRIAGHLLLLQNNYLHYSIEHIGGHHVYACTPRDPHTARLNESFYRFLPRTIAFTFINALKIESARNARKRSNGLARVNRVILFLVLQLVVVAIVLALVNGRAALFLLSQSIVAIFLLHITNYLQHYGLMRKELQDGHYEKVNASHAWRSPSRESGLSLFQLENHADHHMHPNRPYEQLTGHEDSPTHPAGYSGMLLLALIPPLWFREMNWRLENNN